MTTEDTVVLRQLDDALQLRLNVPSLSTADVLYSVGMSIEHSQSNEMQERMADMLRHYCQKYGFPYLSPTEDMQVDRAVILMMTMKRDPTKPKKSTAALNGIGRMAAMKMIGMPAAALNGKSSQYRKLGRRYERAVQKRSEEEAIVLGPTLLVDTQDIDDGLLEPPLISPLTADGNGSVGDASTITELTRESVERYLEDGFFWPTTYPVDQTEDATVYSGGLESYSSVVNPRPQAFANLTTSTNSRNTSAAAHVQRRQIAEYKGIRSALFKSSTILYQTVVDGSNTLKAFDTAEKVAALFNNASRLDLFSGNEIATAVEKGNAGKSPPRRGRPSLIPDEIFRAFAMAVLTFSAIEQINVTERSPRSHLQSLVGRVLNTKREEDGDDPMQEVSFFRRLEMENCTKQNLTPADPRAANR